jgi:hypothetical protein
VSPDEVAQGQSKIDLRDAYNRQVRRGPDTDGTGVTVDVTPQYARWTAANGRGWSEVAWSNFDAASADEVIRAQNTHFAGLDQSFVWRLYNHDLPPDLGARLLTPDSASTRTPRW